MYNQHIRRSWPKCDPTLNNRNRTRQQYIYLGIVLSFPVHFLDDAPFRKNKETEN